jgi:LysM repeat protein
MQGFRQFASAFLLAFFSVLIVLGGLSLSLAEINNPASSIQQTNTPFATPQPITATATLPPSADTATATDTPLPTSTPQPAPSCPPPPTNWISVAVLPGDTLDTIAARHNTSPEQLRAVNCLLTDSVVQGSSLFVPPAPTNTPIRCGPPFGWVKAYTVRPGETLFGISQSYGISLSSLKLANCKDDRNLIYPGETLWVPNLPTRTPTLTATSAPDYVTMNPTEPLTATYLPFTATFIPTDTQAPPTPTLPFTSTPPLPTPTASPTAFR